jgi:uncharacterized protein (TIGR00725 family)
MTQKPVRKPIIGVMGPGSPGDPRLPDHAWKLGKAIALKGWILLSGGRAAGVMEAASRGAYEAGGTTVGILPGHDLQGMSEYVQIPIVTGMGHARNVVNVLSSDVIVICGMGAGTASEAALAVKMNKPLVAAFISPEDLRFLNRLSNTTVLSCYRAEDIIEQIENLLAK